MLKVIIDIILYVLLGAGLSWYYFSWRKRDLLGGFAGGLVVGALGSILGAFVFQTPMKWIIDALQNGLYLGNVNIIAAFAGGFLAMYIFNRINHDRVRKDY